MGKRLQLQLLSDALTREWRKREAGEGQGPEPHEPEGTPPPGGRCVIKGPPVDPGGVDFTRPDQVAPRGRKTFSTRNLKPQTSNRNANKNDGQTGSSAWTRQWRPGGEGGVGVG